MLKWKALCGVAAAIAAACVFGGSDRIMEDIASLFPEDEIHAESYRKLLATGDFSNSFNTSIYFFIPVFTYTLPAAGDNIFNALESQAVTFLTVLTFVVIGSIAILPSLYNVLGIQVSRSENSLSERVSPKEYFINVLEKSLDSIPRTSGEECIKRAVCEAHNHPGTYGLLSLPVQFLFPVCPIKMVATYYTNNTVYVPKHMVNVIPSAMMEIHYWQYPAAVANTAFKARKSSGNSALSHYYQAAVYGRSDGAECTTEYPDCPFDLIDAFKYIGNVVIKSVF